MTRARRSRSAIGSHTIVWAAIADRRLAAEGRQLNLCSVILMRIMSTLTASEFPQAEISNGLVTAKLYLPDAHAGFYRSTRFDWAGTIFRLEYKGHTFFAPWFKQHDPDLRDVEYRAALGGFAAGTVSADIGPVEEFSTPVGYDEAAVGGTFIKIGVGALRKPEEQHYHWATRYEIVDPGKRSAQTGRDSIEFVQELAANGYSYVYSKTVRLSKGKPELVLEHRLRNTGQKRIESSVYDHNFFVIDDLPSGPNFAIKVPFGILDAKDELAVLQIRGKEIGYARELQKDERAMVSVAGFGPTAADYDIRVEHKSGAAVRITADRPLGRFVICSVRPTRCPEPFIDLNVQPGQEFTWRIAYEFSAK